MIKIMYLISLIGCSFIFLAGILIGKASGIELNSFIFLSVGIAASIAPIFRISKIKS